MILTAAIRESTPSPLRFIAFEPYTPAARAFVLGTFSESMRQTPSITLEDRSTYEHALKRLMLEPGAATMLLATPVGSPDEYMGWACAASGALVYAYVRFAYRRGKVLNAHVGSELIRRASGSEECAPIAACIWTTDASRMAAAGFPLRYDLDRNTQLRQLAR